MAREKFYFISYRIETKSGSPMYANIVTKKTPFDFLMLYREVNAPIEPVVLFSQEITKEQAEEYKK